MESETANFPSARPIENVRLPTIQNRLKRDRNAKEGFVILVMGVALEVVAYFTAVL